MILVGQYDSPFVRRVAISLRVLGLPYEHDTRSVFGDFDAMLKVNPVGRIPSLILDDGEVLVDSAAILDHLDQSVGPERALLPLQGDGRRRALRLMALATGGIEKIGASVYERLVRPSACRWPDWIERCVAQGMGAVAALEAEPWPAEARIDQPRITTACLVRYVKMTSPELMPQGRFPRLDALSSLCEARPEFQATFPADYAVPRSA
ncbi:glutathione S-transferase [Rhizobiales bacterium GAS113]|jgi:glutathione S-transferase|nr:glutathione S-transferase [Rhizobiales bacterium GAS113]